MLGSGGFRTECWLFTVFGRGGIFELATRFERRDGSLDVDDDRVISHGEDDFRVGSVQPFASGRSHPGLGAELFRARGVLAVEGLGDSGLDQLRHARHKAGDLRVFRRGEDLTHLVLVSLADGLCDGRQHGSRAPRSSSSSYSLALASHGLQVQLMFLYRLQAILW